MRRMANPSMEDGLISDQTMDDELRIMPTRTAAVELFGAGDWPQTDGRDISKVSLEAWDAAVEDPSRSCRSRLFGGGCVAGADDVDCGGGPQPA